MSTQKNENELYLVLQKKYFLEILKGEKKEEFRAFTDFYIDRLCLFNDAGDLVDVKKFDAVRFQLGYTKNAPQVLAYIQKERLIQPISYGQANARSSGTDIEDIAFLLWCRENYPNDLKKVIAEFPDCDRQLWEYDYNKKQEIEYGK